MIKVTEVIGLLQTMIGAIVVVDDDGEVCHQGDGALSYRYLCLHRMTPPRQGLDVLPYNHTQCTSPQLSTTTKTTTAIVMAMEIGMV
jgi:hypothetical protein